MGNATDRGGMSASTGPAITERDTTTTAITSDLDARQLLQQVPVDVTKCYCRHIIPMLQYHIALIYMTMY